MFCRVSCYVCFDACCCGGFCFAGFDLFFVVTCCIWFVGMDMYGDSLVLTCFAQHFTVVVGFRGFVFCFCFVLDLWWFPTSNDTLCDCRSLVLVF